MALLRRPQSILTSQFSIAINFAPWTKYEPVWAVCPAKKAIVCQALRRIGMQQGTLPRRMDGWMNGQKREETALADGNYCLYLDYVVSERNERVLLFILVRNASASTEYHM